MAKSARHSAKLGGKSRTIISDYYVNEWEGINTYIKDPKQLTDGQSPDSLNWLTGKYKDHIELRRGYALLGTTRNSGTGRITGLGVARNFSGTETPFFSYGQKFKYYNASSGDTAEIGSNILPAKANGEDISFANYQNLAGCYMYASSPNSSIYKLDAVNPSSYSDLLSLSFRGNLKIENNRSFLWNRKDAYRSIYQNVLYVGVSDKSDISQYTQTTKESVGTGDGATATFSGTLAYKGSNSKATCFATEFAGAIASGVSITAITKATQALVTAPGNTFAVGDAVIITGAGGMTEINGLIGIVMGAGSTLVLSINSTSFTTYTSGGLIYKAEYFIDDLNGNLSSIQGGTGTINYTTGAYTLNFTSAPISTTTIYAQYYTEDATSGGVADFTIDGSTAGKGKIFNQFDGGGPITAVQPFDQVQYCFHLIRTWYLSLSTNDTQASNLPYRSLVGCPYLRAANSTSSAVVFVDTSNPQQPRVKVLEIDQNSATAVVTVVPNTLSEDLDLSTYGFSKAVVWRWGDYDLVACEGSLNGIVQGNNTFVWCRNTYTGHWDLLDYSASCFATYMGTLLAGDDLSNNVFTLFSGFDDDGTVIANHWISKTYDLGITGVKKFNRFYIRGLIQADQNIDISFSFDDGPFTKYFTVAGTGSYVDVTNPVSVGANTVGSQVVGGGQSGGQVVESGAATSYTFEVDFPVSSDLFEYAQVQFQANNVGYAQINEFAFRDCRYKGRKMLPAHTK